jgi:hypothetical protein
MLEQQFFSLFQVLSTKSAHLKFSFLDHSLIPWRLTMYARNVAIRLKPNTLSNFSKTFETNVLPILRKQKGFQDEITFAMPGGTDVVAISLWDTKENAEAYNTAGYPQVLKNLEKFLDGSPKLRVSDVISSTFHTAGVSA